MQKKSHNGKARRQNFNSKQMLETLAEEEREERNEISSQSDERKHT